MKQSLFFLGIIILFCGCTTPNLPTDPNFHIVNTRTKKVLEYDKFINELLRYDIVLIGELHENRAHQQAQLQIINSLKKRQKLDVVFEMINLAKASENISKNIDKNALKDAIGWSARWDYAFYQDLVESVFIRMQI